MNYYRVSKNSKKYKKNMKGGFENNPPVRGLNSPVAPRGRILTPKERLRLAQEAYEQRVASRGNKNGNSGNRNSGNGNRVEKKSESIGNKIAGYLIAFIPFLISFGYSFNHKWGFDKLQLSFLGIGVFFIAINYYLILIKDLKKSIKIIMAIIPAIVIIIYLVNSVRFFILYQDKVKNAETGWGSRLTQFQEKKEAFKNGIILSVVGLVAPPIIISILYFRKKKSYN